jgi:D-glycero-D-manno-heptose 1,7-bisphosphate phosphatase
MTNAEHTGKRVIFLDRDGVLNVDKHVTYRLSQLALIDGVVEGLSNLQALGFAFIIVTNQSAVGRGLFTEEDLHCFNKALCARLEDNGVHVLDLFFCPHDAVFGIGEYKQKCACHKPAPGMFFTAADKYDLDLSQCYYVGDKRSDVVAAFNAGCRAILVETGILNDEHLYPGDYPHIRVKDLPAAARIIAGELALARMQETGAFVPPFDAALCKKFTNREG